MPSLTGFLYELKRRRVFRVTAVYAGIAFILIQVADITFPALNLPDWTITFVLVVLLIGFPITVGLAWAFDITAKGVVRTPAEDQCTPVSTRRPIFGNLVLAIVAALAIAVAAWSWLRNPGETSTDKSIAVLPFVNMSNSQDDEYFSDGVTDDIITHLTKIGALKVISRTSTILYKDSPKSLRIIANELGVSNILEGSVRRAGDKVRITSQLIDARTDEHLWAETYDRDLTDIFTIQSDVALNIATALKAVLSPEVTARIERRPTESTEAYDYYLRAHEYERQSSERKTFEFGIGLHKKAIAVDPNFAQAHARLGYNHAAMYWMGYDRTSQRLAMAREAVDKALRIKPDDPVVRVANGYYHYWGSRDYARALEEFYFARGMEPGNGEHASNIAYIQRRLGKFEEAAANLKTALDSDPLSSSLAWELGKTYVVLRRFDLAEQSFDKAIELSPTNSWAYSSKAWIQIIRMSNTDSARQVLSEGIRLADPSQFSFDLVEFDIEDNRYNEALDRLATIPEDGLEGITLVTPKETYVGWIFELMEQSAEALRHFENARVLLEENVRESPDDPRFHAALGQVYAHLGLADEALQECQQAVELLSISLDAYDGPDYLQNLAEVYTILGEPNEALDILENLLEIPSAINVGALKFHRIWDPLREHPRFQALLEKYE
jgi:TolB-like protein/Flp pilus assembly protein TadD